MHKLDIKIHSCLLGFNYILILVKNAKTHYFEADGDERELGKSSENVCAFTGSPHHRGFLGEEEIRVEPNPCKMRNVLVLNHSNGGNSFSKSTF